MCVLVVMPRGEAKRMVHARNLLGRTSVGGNGEGARRGWENHQTLMQGEPQVQERRADVWTGVSWTTVQFLGSFGDGTREPSSQCHLQVDSHVS